ncbi:MAG: CotH kinase family protein [Bacilli bacterium]|nr:CotH kinase family protein [Bacilli bacterium]
MHRNALLPICSLALLSCSISASNSDASHASSAEDSIGVVSQSEGPRSSFSSSEGISASGPSSSSCEVGQSEEPASSILAEEGIHILTPSASFREVFELGSDVSVRLSFDKGTLHDLSYFGAYANRKYADVYFPGTVTFTVNGVSETFEDAGVRMKGNTSRREFVSEDGGIYRMSHFKVSLKATFDDALYDLPELSKYRHDWSGDPSGRAARKDRNFRGMEKIDLKYMPRNNDTSVGQEIYAYNAFRGQGLLAPHANYAGLTIENGISSLAADYEIIEPIDKEFLKRHLGKQEAQGDLYKCLYGPMGKADFTRTGSLSSSYDEDGYTCGTRVSRGKIGVRDSYDGYFPCYDLKTNDSLGEAADFSKMEGYINAMWNLRYKGAGQELLESTLDVDWFLRFEAVSYLLGNFDDQRNNANNFYLYFLPSSGKAIYIPYDWDWCLGADMGLDTENWEPYRRYDMNGDTVPSNVYFVTFFKGSEETSYSMDGYRAKYDAYIKKALEDGVLDYENYEAQVGYAPDGLKTQQDSVRDYMGKKKSAANSYYSW